MTPPAAYPFGAVLPAGGSGSAQTSASAAVATATPSPTPTPAGTPTPVVHVIEDGSTKTATDARTLLREAGYVVEYVLEYGEKTRATDGMTVKSQSPTPGSRVDAGSTMTLSLLAPAPAPTVDPTVEPAPVPAAAAPPPALQPAAPAQHPSLPRRLLPRTRSCVGSRHHSRCVAQEDRGLEREEVRNGQELPLQPRRRRTAKSQVPDVTRWHLASVRRGRRARRQRRSRHG
jgi:hypothetical protein